VAKQERGIMKNEMPSPLLDEKNMLYKVTSRYTAKFLAGHYCIGQRLLPSASPSLRVVASRMITQPRHYVPRGYSTLLGRAAPKCLAYVKEKKSFGWGLEEAAKRKASPMYPSVTPIKP